MAVMIEVSASAWCVRVKGPYFLAALVGRKTKTVLSGLDQGMRFFNGARNTEQVVAGQIFIFEGFVAVLNVLFVGGDVELADKVGGDVPLHHVDFVLMLK